MPSQLELAVYRTLAYFSYFKYPLSSFEIWKWLLEPGRPVTLVDVVHELDSSLWLKSRVQKHNGFFGLGDTATWYHDRHVRFLDAMRKFAKAERAVQVLGRLPWVGGIAVCNSLSWYHTRADSDIDFFVIAKPGRVWSVRLLSTIPAILLRQRPGEATSDPVCLSFFCAETALDFSTLKIDTLDPYLAYWSRALVPLVDHSGWVERFQKQNLWLDETLPHARPVTRAHRFRSSIRLRWPWLPLSERLPRQLQMDKFPAQIKELMNKDSRVVVSDEMLKFHEQDARELIALTLADKVRAYENVD